MIWRYSRFSQKLAEFGGGIVPRQGWSAAEAYKEPIFTGFRLDNRLPLIGSSQREMRINCLNASEPVLDCVQWSQGAGVWI